VLRFGKSFSLLNEEGLCIILFLIYSDHEVLSQLFCVGILLDLYYLVGIWDFHLVSLTPVPVILSSKIYMDLHCIQSWNSGYTLLHWVSMSFYLWIIIYLSVHKIVLKILCLSVCIVLHTFHIAHNKTIFSILWNITHTVTILRSINFSCLHHQISLPNSFTSILHEFLKLTRKEKQ
jgi:hypothetical protein